jgi:hypothetical protein
VVAATCIGPGPKPHTYSGQADLHLKTGLLTPNEGPPFVKASPPPPLAHAAVSS